MTNRIPTLYDWAGGIDALNRLTARFYQRVHEDVVLAPIFAHMDGEHPQHVAAFLAEVLERLPADYRMVILLRNIEEMSHEEIAERMHRSVGAVRMLWVRALAALRDELQASG